ncbi:24-hydroxycholesterol 7-alpha-hydroxylase-like [Ruditapes philippinarum]|uniref:24-hydroxycholesterol 7-alpha-hydroxylase-like n=1 Tax=Ruditapes philippinarum TaxID=129788 RepID=UPI00295BF765|nr:24-hydroxycholesterol 7-alpha-hydroxylase-like [Ruditapes philippinarum]
MWFDIWREASFTFGDSVYYQSNARIDLILVLSALILLYFKCKHGASSPPLCGRWIPWFGCAIHMGKQPLRFIRRKSRKFGPIFTLYCAGERLTFLTDPQDFHYFFNNPDLDFQEAVQVPVQKLASISREEFYKFHTKLHDMVKGRLAPIKIGQLGNTLSEQLNRQFDRHVDLKGPQDLMVITQRCMYASVLNTIFGDGNPLVNDQADYEEFLKQFKIFDEDFEYGVKLPSVFLPKWSAAKRYFLTRIEVTFKKMKGQHTQSEKLNMVNALLEKLDGDKVTHKFGMLVMFASIANAVPAAYWMLTYILTNENVQKKVLAELNDVFKDFKGKNGSCIKEADLKKLKYLHCCVYETIRIRSEGIIGRKVVRDTKIKGFHVAAGSMLMISPYLTHRDERYFEDPEVFKPERWADGNFEKPGFVAFGGGRYQCPGRWFGMMSMQTFVTMFFLKYTFKVHSLAPIPNMSHLIGVQHPLSEFLVSCSERK